MRAFLLIVVATTFVATSAPAAEPIGRVLSCGRSGEAGGLAGGDDMTRVTVDMKRYPSAVCNDGSPAVFYVAPHTRAEDRDKWVIFLQGGGGCRTGDLCARRWCSVDTNFGMDKMTSTTSKPSIRGDGILSPRATNYFGTWNRVLIYYCSSDNWAGTKSVTLTATNPKGSESVDYAIEFKGHYIVEAVIDTLRRAGRRSRPVRASTLASGTSAEVLLPDLDDATDILFGGSSAGGGGVRNNMDRLAAKLRASNNRCRSGAPCALDFRAVIDATLQPDHSQLDWAGSEMCARAPYACNYATFYAEEWKTSVTGTWGWVSDESCVAWHAIHQPGTEWKCADDTHLLTNHLTTPFFVRQDLQDELLTGNFVEAGFGTEVEFGELVRAKLEELPTIDAFAEEGSARGGTRIEAPGVFGPQCKHHESLARNEAFYNVFVNDSEGFKHSFHDLLVNWWTRSGSMFAVREFNAPGAAPECR